PRHASSSRELIACADVSLLEAKANGKDRVVVYDDLPVRMTRDAMADGEARTDLDRADGTGYGRGLKARMAVLDTRGESRSVAQLRMLQSLSAKLNRLNNVEEIGEAI